MSCMGMPWRYASATPSPVSDQALEVMRNIRPKPPVASMTAFAPMVCIDPSAIR